MHVSLTWEAELGIRKTVTELISSVSFCDDRSFRACKSWASCSTSASKYQNNSDNQTYGMAYAWNGLCTSDLNLITLLRRNEIHGRRDSFSTGTLSVSPREPPIPHPRAWRKMINLPPKVNHILKMFLLENEFIIWWQESSLWYLTSILWTTKTSIVQVDGESTTGQVGIMPHSVKLKQKFYSKAQKGVVLTQMPHSSSS